MSFANPQFLYALGLLVIPLIIHLFRFWIPRKVFFPNVRFLKNIEQQNKTRNQLKHLLVMFARMLAIAALVFAFARPYIPVDGVEQTDGANAISIYVDNSFSMTNTGEDANLIDEAIFKTEEIVRSYRENDVFQLVTNDFKLRHQRFLPRNEFLEMLSDVRESPASRNLSLIIDRQTEALIASTYENKIAFIISDFQVSTTDIDAIRLDDEVLYYFSPLEAQGIDNLYIDSAWFSSPFFQINQNNRLEVRIVNASPDNEADGTVTFRVNGRQKAIGNYEIPAGGTEIVEIPFSINETGWNKAEIEIDDYPVVFDDIYYLTYPVFEHTNVLVINRRSPSRYLEALYQTDEYFQVTNMSEGQVDVASFNAYDVIVLNGLSQISSGMLAELNTYVSQGGNVILIPSEEGEYEIYNALLESVNTNTFVSEESVDQAVRNININSKVFSDVFDDLPDNVNLPSVKQYYRLSERVTRQENLLTLRNGDPFLSHHPYGNGRLFILSVPLSPEWTNFQNHAVFVPALYNMTLYRETHIQTAHMIGAHTGVEVSVPSNGRDQMYKLTKNGFEMIPPQRRRAGNLLIYPADHIREAGIYDLSLPNISEDVNMPSVAFNYNRAESDLRFYNIRELQEALDFRNIRYLDADSPDVSSALRELERGQSLWRLFLWFALMALLIEVLLLKYWKR